MKHLPRYFAFGTVLALATGCALGPDFQSPEVEKPATFRGQTANPDPGSLADYAWWQLFDDPVLQDTVKIALAYNRDLGQAIARVEQARAQAGVARGALVPSVGYSATAARGQNSFAGNPGLNGGQTTNTGLGVLNAAWEFDLWGRVRRLNEQAQAAYLATEEGRRAAQLTLVSEVASTYYTVLALDEQLALAQASEKAYTETRDLFNRRYEGGVVSKLEAARAEAARAQAAASIPEIERQLLQAENALNLLMGQMPGPIGRGRPLSGQVLATEVPAGLPASLLERRPDIRAAEQRLRAANALVGVRIAEFLPKIGLTAAFGQISPDLKDFSSPANRTWSVAADVSGPLFNGGANVARYQEAKAAWEEAKQAYEGTVLAAFGEVSNTLFARLNLARTAVEQQKAVEALNQAVTFAVQRYTNGKASYDEVLQAQQQLYPAQAALIDNQLARLDNVLSLYRALGGGYYQGNLEWMAGAPGSPATPLRAADQPE